MIRFVSVHKEYPRAGAVLGDVSFHIARGEFVFLTGPSGAGKSTILKLMYLAEQPSRGEVWVNGVRSPGVRRAAVPLLRRQLGVVFQDFSLLDDRTAEENVAFALEVTGTPSAAIPERVARALAKVGLAAKGRRYPRELSGGEQQRVAIARALVNDPFVLIADEPTGNLDDRSSRGVFQLLNEINASGTAVVLATHDLELVRRAAHRLIEVDRGRIVLDTAEAPRAPHPRAQAGD